MSLLLWAPVARSEDDIEEYITFYFSYDGEDYLLDAAHGINEIVTGPVRTDFDHALSYDLTSNKIAEYEAAISASLENDIDLDLRLDWDGSWNLSSGISQSIEGDNFDLDLGAQADFEIYGSEFEDDFLDDDDLLDDDLLDDDDLFDDDDFLFDEDDDDTDTDPEWLVDYTLEFSGDLDFEPLPAGVLELRPSVNAGLDYDSDFGWEYEAAAGIGIALSPEARGREAKSEFASSNVGFSHAGGSFAVCPGEVVLAGGRSDSGLYKVAALIFNEWEPTDTFAFEFGAITEFEYVDGEGLIFDEAELAADATLEPAEDWEVDVSATVTFDSDNAPAYDFFTGISNSTYAAFQPSARAALDWSDGGASVMLQFDVESALGDNSIYSLGISTGIETDGGIDEVNLSFGVDINGMPLVEDGDDTELSFVGSYEIVGRDLTLDASMSVYF